MKRNALQRATGSFAKKSRPFGKLARDPGRRTQDVQSISLASANSEKLTKLITRGQKAVAKGLYCRHGEEFCVEPAPKSSATGWDVAINVVGKAVTARMFNSLLAEIAPAPGAGVGRRVRRTVRALRT